MTPVDATSIPTGEVVPVVGTRFDFTSPRPIREGVGADGWAQRSLPWTSFALLHLRLPCCTSERMDSMSQSPIISG